MPIATNQTTAAMLAILAVFARTALPVRQIQQTRVVFTPTPSPDVKGLSCLSRPRRRRL